MHRANLIKLMLSTFFTLHPNIHAVRRYFCDVSRCSIFSQPYMMNVPPTCYNNGTWVENKTDILNSFCNCSVPYFGIHCEEFREYRHYFIYHLLFFATVWFCALLNNCWKINVVIIKGIEKPELLISYYLFIYLQDSQHNVIYNIQHNYSNDMQYTIYNKTNNKARDCPQR